MYQITKSTIIFNLFLIWSVSVNAVRISPKLDFGDSNTKTLNAGFRPITETRYLRDKSNYQADTAKVENLEIVCISGNCSTIKSTTENTNGISADVLVHIKANVDASKIKNDSIQSQPVPDVPIVIGTKSTTVPTFSNNRPYNAPNPVTYNSNYPVIDLLPPISTNNAFIPSSRSDFVQNPHLYTDSQIRGYPGVPNYAPRFLGHDNDVGVQTNYFVSPFNGNNNVNVNNRPIASRPGFYPKGVRGGNYNPVEFRKTYNNNNWSPVKWSRNDQSNSDRRTGSGIPRWTPCVCQNPELHQYPTTPTYPQRNQPPGISGKLTPLI